ncbi:MAG: putative toxin-antitoxin system toxin component, PIN family [Candidatus Diapherotrites archaeon]|nr:putative toxin-antitoxin system toxin component, PIN family [Candidatus Diapherotrites archaeon]
MEQIDKRTEQEGNFTWNQRRRRGQNYSRAEKTGQVKVVLDTNILISAFFWNGNPHKILALCFSGRINVFSSQELIDELKNSIFRDFNVSEESLLAKINELLENIVLVCPVRRVFTCEDPDDNKVLETALEAGVQFIVSGDKHLLKMKEFEGIRIMGAKEFLDLFH